MNNNNQVLKVIWKVVKKRFKLSHLLFIALLLTCNSFAWFIYMNKIDNDIDVKVKAWNVSFRFDNQTMSDYIKFDVRDIYPGMEDNRQEVSVTNDGEVAAKLYYEIISVRIFDKTYSVNDDGLSSSEIENVLNQSYPFKINISSDKEVIDGKGGAAKFIVNVSWPYETLDDNGELKDLDDTYWGNKAYSYGKVYPDKPCILLNIKLSATQVNN